MLISGLKNTDGRSVEEVMQLEATEHFKKQGLQNTTETKG